MDVYQRRRLVALSAIAALFIIIVLLVRSCGGDDEETPIAPVAGATGTGAATALTQEEYAAEGDSICQETNAAIANIDAPDEATLAAEEAELLQSQLEQLQTLPIPDDGETKLESYLAALQTQAEGLDDLAKALDRGADPTSVQTEVDNAASEAENAAGNFGFEICGTDEVGESSASGEGNGGQAETDASVEGTEVAPPVTETTPPVTETTPPATETTPPATEGGVATEPPPTDTGTDTGTGGTGGITP